MFWKNFNSLCEQKGVSPNFVCKELGFSNATATHWKNGVPPSSKSLTKIASYFDVSTDYLLNGSDDISLPQEEQELLLLFRKISHEQQGFIKDSIRGLIATNRQKGAIKMDKYNEISILDEKMREMANNILSETAETINIVMKESHDVNEIKKSVAIDVSLIEDAKEIYIKNSDKLARDEVDYFFTCCDKFIESINKVLGAKTKKEVSEAKLECHSCYKNLNKSIDDTVLEHSEELDPFA